MSGIGWPSHDEDEKSRIARCYTDVDQPTGCPLCILRSENERLREALREIAGAECLRDEIMDCRAVAPDRPGKWCMSCSARAVLAEVGK